MTFMEDVRKMAEDMDEEEREEFLIVAVKMTVKETTHENQPNPLYTIETIEISKPTRMAPQSGVERAPDVGRDTPQVGFNTNITKELINVNRILKQDAGYG